MSKPDDRIAALEAGFAQLTAMLSKFQAPVAAPVAPSPTVVDDVFGEIPAKPVAKKSSYVSPYTKLDAVQQKAADILVANGYGAVMASLAKMAPTILSQDAAAKLLKSVVLGKTKRDGTQRGTFLYYTFPVTLAKAKQPDAWLKVEKLFKLHGFRYYGAKSNANVTVYYCPTKSA